jgi:hypothetical protein
MNLLDGAARTAVFHLRLLHDHLGPKRAPSICGYLAALIEGFRL